MYGFLSQALVKVNSNIVALRALFHHLNFWDLFFLLRNILVAQYEGLGLEFHFHELVLLLPRAR